MTYLIADAAGAWKNSACGANGEVAQENIWWCGQSRAIPSLPYLSQFQEIFRES